jgi:hypothetical protein
MADYVGPWGRPYYESVAYDEPPPENELKYLQDVMGEMEKDVKALQKRIAELKAKPKE